jgi:hypothetical protein
MILSFFLRDHSWKGHNRTHAAQQKIAIRSPRRQ